MLVRLTGPTSAHCTVKTSARQVTDIFELHEDVRMYFEETQPQEVAIKIYRDDESIRFDFGLGYPLSHTAKEWEAIYEYNGITGIIGLSEY